MMYTDEVTNIDTQIARLDRQRVVYMQAIRTLNVLGRSDDDIAHLWEKVREIDLTMTRLAWQKYHGLASES